MKALMLGMTILSCAITAWGEVFQLDRKSEATVEVKEAAGEYRVTCRFKPQKKFDKAVNAKFNDAKGDSLCKQGLSRYLKVAPGETLSVSGLHPVAPVETDGDKVCYWFGIPVAGCKVQKSVARQKPAAVPKASVAAAPKLPQELPQAASGSAKPTSYLCVSKYKEVNGKRTTISQREYQPRNFKSPKEFESFCQQEFDRIRAIGAKNLREVRNFGK